MTCRESETHVRLPEACRTNKVSSDRRKVPVSNDNVIKGLLRHVGTLILESVSQHRNEFHPGPREALPRYDTYDEGV
jgi:hypothetical protein